MAVTDVSAPTRPRAHRRPPSRSPLGDLRRADPELRQLVVRTRAWGLALGRACSTDALTVVVGIAIAEARDGLASPLWWTVARVDELVAVQAGELCANYDVARPEGVAEALRLWLEYLHATTTFSEGSDPFEVLITAVTSGRRGSRRGRGFPRLAARHPSGGGRAG